MAGMHYDIVIVGGGAGGLELAARSRLIAYGYQSDMPV